MDDDEQWPGKETHVEDFARMQFSAATFMRKTDQQSLKLQDN